jgi:hypothetical protein
MQQTSEGGGVLVSKNLYKMCIKSLTFSWVNWLGTLFTGIRDYTKGTTGKNKIEKISTWIVPEPIS